VYLIIPYVKSIHTVALLVRITSDGDTKLELLLKNHIWGEIGEGGD